MSSFNEGINIDSDSERSSPFLARQVMDSLALSVVESLLLFSALFVGDLLLFWIKDIPVDMKYSLFLIPAWWMGAWMTHLAPGWGLGAVEELRRVQLLLLVLFSTATVVTFLQKQSGFSRISFVAAYLVAVVLLPFGRILAKKGLAALKLWGVPAVIYGTRDTVLLIAEALRRDRAVGFIPKAVMCDDCCEGEIIAGLPVLGGLNHTTRRMPVAVVALPEMPRSNLIRLLEGPLRTYNTILLIPDLMDAPSLWVKPCDLQGILALEIRHNLLDPVSRFSKLFTERAVVFFTLPLWGPLCLFMMLLIWLQDFNSPIYSQTRVGRKDRKFQAYKLRTMVPDAENVLLHELAKNPALKAEWDQHYKLKKDPRITAVGRFLRKTSLDELPQLWCVLTGTMALVGPRPLPEYHHEELKARTQRMRCRVRPGITGLWQVSGRSDSGTVGMDKWDTYYVTNWSIWLDLIILARTLRVVLMGSGAY